MNATASISAADTSVGELIAESMDKVGKEGVITVEESNTFGLELELTEGMRFDKGYISHYFVTDAERMESVLDELCDVAPSFIARLDEIGLTPAKTADLARVMTKRREHLGARRAAGQQGLSQQHQQRRADDELTQAESPLAPTRRDRGDGARDAEHRERQPGSRQQHEGGPPADGGGDIVLSEFGRNSEHRHLRDLRHVGYDLLDLERRDVLSATAQRILLPILEPEIAVLVELLQLLRCELHCFLLACLSRRRAKSHPSGVR